MQVFFASAPRNLGSLLAEELLRIGVHEATETKGGARFVGHLIDGYRACLWSRIANRILFPLVLAPSHNPDDLYAIATEIPWEEHIAPGSTFAVQFDGELPGIQHAHFAALRVKDAVVDHFLRKYGWRPNVDSKQPDLQIHVYGQQETIGISLDLSGTSLHLRGYRASGGSAPLKENLAAALLLRAGWPELAAAGGALLDPMCGTGTLVIEGALIAADIAPGLARARFGFQGWKQHDPKIWERLLSEAQIRRTAGLKRLGSMRGYDHDPQAIRSALDHARRAGLAGFLHFEQRELNDCYPGSAEDEGLVIINPPYGERLGVTDDLFALYARLGAILRERFLGWRATVFTGDQNLTRQTGLRAQRIHTLYNGPIECKLLHFQLEPHNFLGTHSRTVPLPERSASAQMFANRLIKNLKIFTKWRQAERIDCLRIYDADLPEYALAIDLYEGNRLWVQVQEYEAPPTVDPRCAQVRLREALDLLPEILEVPNEQIFLKIRRRQRGQNQYERLAETRKFYPVREGEYRFLVNFEDYLDTGLFLDHREIRRLIGSQAAGMRFLNLFGYTGTATVYAAKGGAVETTTIDLSRTYLDWAARNLALNKIQGDAHQLIQADCICWLENIAQQRQFDLILLDPPSFSTSNRMHKTLDIQRDHVALIHSAVKLLSPTGSLIFANNFRRFHLDQTALNTFKISDLSATTLPKDFARTPKMHHCWLICRK